MCTKEIEQYLMQIRSIGACKVQTDENGEIKEIHILSNSQRNPKQISRDVQSVLISKFGLDIDYKKISIAQVGEGLAEYANSRLKLKTIEYSIADKRAVIRVILEKDNELFEGVVTGPSTNISNQRMLGKATLKAIENYYSLDESLVLEDVTTSTIAGKEAVVVVVTSMIDGSERLLSGSAIVDKDKNEAVVKATLDAVNRTILKLPR